MLINLIMMKIIDKFEWIRPIFYNEKRSWIESTKNFICKEYIYKFEIIHPIYQ